jgi:hypothetical protein
VANKDVDRFNELFLFSMEQLTNFISTKLEDHRNNNELADNKPIVYRENLALYEEELFYVNSTKKFIKTIDINQFNTPEEFKDYLFKAIQEHYQEHGIPDICWVIFSDKLKSCWEFYTKG